MEVYYSICLATKLWHQGRDGGQNKRKWQEDHEVTDSGPEPPRNRCEWFMRLRKCSIHEVADEIACHICIYT